MSVGAETGPGQQEYVSQLERAIQELNTVRHHLQENAHQVKCQIHSTVSRELEALRNREVWLLNQVDILQNVKEDILRGQQAQINRELGRAENGLLQRDRQTTDAVTTHFNRLELTDLGAEETPHISFQADASGLRDSIMEFGKVEAGNRNLQKVFTNTPSASLPKPFEEYDDAEHHVLYKTLEEVNRGKTASSNIVVNIPKLALKPEDWLVKPSVKPEKIPVKLNLPTLSNNISDWLINETKSKAHLTKDKSIQNWLMQIKHFPHTHDEEDDFEIVEHVTISDASESTVDTQMSSQSSPQSTVTRTISPTHFTQVTPATMATWLKDGMVLSPSDMENTNVLPPGFHPHYNESATWLCNSEKSCEQACVLSPDPIEIENLGTMLCLSEKTVFSHKADDQKMWLCKSSLPPVDQVCKANEPCECAEDCLSSPPCQVEYAMSTQKENVWLLNGCENKGAGMFSHRHNVSNDDRDWLMKSSPVKHQEGIPNPFSAWLAYITDETLDWLKGGNSGIEPMDTACPAGFDDMKKWLQQNALNAVSPDGDISDSAWLSSSGKESKDDTKDTESEKKDSSEKMEMTKWLLSSVTQTPAYSKPLPISPGLSVWLFDKQL